MMVRLGRGGEGMRRREIREGVSGSLGAVFEETLPSFAYALHEVIVYFEQDSFEHRT